MPLPVIPVTAVYFASGFLLGATTQKFGPVVVKKAQSFKEKKEKEFIQDYELKHQKLKKVPY